MATAVAKIGCVLKTDAAEFTVFEGDIVNNLVYKDGTTQKTLTGRVRVISGSTTAQNTGPTDCPPEPYVHRYVNPTMLVIDSSDENYAILTRINISNIVSIESVMTEEEAEDAGQVVVGTGAEYQSLDAVIAAVEPGATVKLLAGTYANALTITKSITIRSVDGAVLSGKIAIASPAALNDGTTAAPVHVVLDGLTITGDALISVAGIDSFTMVNCNLVGHSMSEGDARTMLIHFTDEHPCLVTIENNTFGDEPQYSYNLIECQASLKDGSSITNNYFTDQSCQHNQISLYNIEDNATIKINKNHAEISKNMVRIGFKGAPVGTVLMDGNSYDATDSDPAWSGLFVVQPYKKETISFSGITIRVDNTTMAPTCNNQIGYIYAGADDTPFTEDNKPVIFVDGVKATIPDSSPSVTVAS